MSKETIGPKIKQFRKKRKLTQEEIDYIVEFLILWIKREIK